MITLQKLLNELSSTSLNEIVAGCGSGGTKTKSSKSVKHAKSTKMKSTKHKSTKNNGGGCPCTNP